MFHLSTQRKFWILENSEKIAEAQSQANKAFIDIHLKRCKKYNLPQPAEFLAYYDEKLLLIYYSQFINDICRKFKPPVPLSVIGMSITYFKRFYLSTSVMEFHPKEIAVLCVYLACKVDEYNVSIDQFMEQVCSQPNPGLQMFIIDNELLLLQKLNFHLTVHCPYRPLEGLLIDMKTKRSQLGLDDIESYRPKTERFLANCTLTDVMLMYPPSQIALSALSHAIGSKFNVYLEHLASGKALLKLTDKIENIQSCVLNFKFPNKVEIEFIEEKLSNCRDFENDPGSTDYHKRDNTKKEAKELQKRKKYQELSNIQNAEDRMLAQDMSISE